MTAKIKERCIYCGGDVYYHGSEKLIKCEWCGQTINTTKFESYLIRIQETEDESILIKQQLAEAEKEKQAADNRLFSALSSLGQIQNDQDILGKMLHTLTKKQEDAQQSLQFLKDISKRLVDSQNDIFARMGVIQEIGSRLQKIDMNEQERQSVMNEFILWSQQIKKEDIQRLQKVQTSADKLMEGQTEIKEKVNTLREKTNQLQNALDTFHVEYTKDKLREMQRLYRQAANFQYDREYNKAEEYYHRVLTKGGDDSEVYWRLLMCHYCLFYQKDNDGHLIPIILNPDLTDPAEMSLRRELEHHMAEQEKPYYLSELNKIDRILDKYRLLKDQVQYDVFISVMQNQDGHYTTDSDVASDLYDFLEDQGFKIFNSRRTVIPAGQEYEPYIISALMSAKALIVVGTSAENMNSPWVKNEWSRFQWLQYHEKKQTGKTDRVLFCYLAKGMQAEHIPKALNPNRQAIRDGVKAHDELIAGLAFLKPAITVTPPPPTEFTQIDNLLKYWLIQGRFEDVKQKCQELADKGLYLTHASLHLAALCAENKANDIMQVVNSDIVLEKTKEFKAALVLCIDEESMLQNLLVKNTEWRSKFTHETQPDPEPAEEDFLKQGIEAEEKEDYTTAIKWYRKASEQGIAEAHYLLGLCYENGNGIKKNRKTALNWYRKASDSGFSEATNHLGFCYENGIGVTADVKEANKWYQKAADQGNENAKKKLEHLFLDDHGTPDDWYRLGKEAEDNHNDSETEKWYLKAAEAGHVEAQYSLGLYYLTSKNYNNTTVQWFQKAAEQGHAEACYYTGYLKELYDKKEAVKWYKEAANKGISEAQYRLGRCYDYGIGVTKNEKLAEKWYQKAIDKGNEHARENLSLLKKSKEGSPDDWYLIGKKAEQKGDNYKNTSIERNGYHVDSYREASDMYQQAVAWYKKAANAGQADAQMALAFCYKDGKGVPRPNNGLFHDWAYKGVDQCKEPLLRNRYADYLFKEGCKHEDEFKGKLTLYDRKIAKSYYQRAAALGHKEAKQKLSRLFW